MGNSVEEMMDYSGDYPMGYPMGYPMELGLKLGWTTLLSPMSWTTRMTSARSSRVDYIMKDLRGDSVGVDAIERTV